MPQPPRLLDYLRQVLAEYFADKPVRRVQAVGSYARGEATAELDLMVEKVAPAGWGCSSHADGLQEKLGIKVDLGSGVPDSICRCIGKDLKTLMKRPAKKRPRVPDRAHHLARANKLITAFTADRTFHDLLTDVLFRPAAERQFEILGKASSHVSSATQVRWLLIKFLCIRNLRNMLAHQYFRTDYAEAGNVAQNLLPTLLPTLEELFTGLDRQFSPYGRV